MTDDGGDDAIALKSGLCKAGVDFATPTANVRIEHAVMRTRDACFCTGSEDEGGRCAPQSPNRRQPSVGAEAVFCAATT